MNLELEIEKLFHPFSINHFDISSAYHDFTQANKSLEYYYKQALPYYIMVSMQQQFSRSQKIYKLIDKNLPLALTSPHPYIRAFANLIRDKK